jgi:EAL domain-containing protein (putative c-di-GMP-specific phosphodiesterase class I)
MPGVAFRDEFHRMLDASHAGFIDLAHALRAGWVEFWYQPKIDLRDRTIIGVEMFARARHPFHGVISGGVILAGADQTLLMQLAVFSLRWALQASAAMAQEHVRIPITVNMPACAIDPKAIAALLAQGPQAKDWGGLVFDVPKHEILSHHERLAQIAPQLAGLGIRLAADDFCGNLRRLMRSTDPEALYEEMETLSKTLRKLTALSLAEIKLERDLTAGCSEDKSRTMLCELIVELIHKLESKATAVGVERHADIAVLGQIGCDVAQGYAFSEPKPLEEFLALLKRRAKGLAITKARSSSVAALRQAGAPNTRLR